MFLTTAWKIITGYQYLPKFLFPFVSISYLRCLWLVSHTSTSWQEDLHTHLNVCVRGTDERKTVGPPRSLRSIASMFPLLPGYPVMCPLTHQLRVPSVGDSSGLFDRERTGATKTPSPHLQLPGQGTQLTEASLSLSTELAVGAEVPLPSAQDGYFLFALPAPTNRTNSDAHRHAFNTMTDCVHTKFFDWACGLDLKV